MNRKFSLFLVFALMLQSVPMAFAGGDPINSPILFSIDGPGVSIDKGKGGPGQMYQNDQVITVKPGKGGQIYVDQSGQVIQQGQQGQYVGVSPYQGQSAVIPAAPSQFSTYQFYYTQNCLRDYKRWRNRAQRGTIVILPPKNRQPRQMNQWEYRYWMERERMKHEQRMMEMRMRYEERMRAREERELARQRRAQTQMAALSLGFGTIFALVSMQQARRDERRADRRYHYYDQMMGQQYYYRK